MLLRRAKLADVMQGMPRQLALLIDCSGNLAGAKSLPLLLLGRLVGCVHTSHVAAHVAASLRGCVTVVLLGYCASCIGADWSDDEPDEFDVARLE